MSQLVTTSSNLEIAAFIANFNSKHTRDAYTRDLISFSKFLEDNKVVIAHPSHLRLPHLIAYREHLISTFKSKTVSRKLATVKSLMKWLESTGALTFNPAAALKVPTANVTTPTNALTDEEVREMLLLSSINPIHNLMLTFLFTYGLRRTELCKLEISDFFTDGASMGFKVKGKGGKERLLPLVEHLSDVVKIQLQANSQYLFEHNRQPFTPSGVYNIFKRYAKLAGIERDVSPHSARATVATKALETNIPITQVAEDLGHSSVLTTQIYWKRRNGLSSSMAHKIKY